MEGDNGTDGRGMLVCEVIGGGTEGGVTLGWEVMGGQMEMVC